MITEADVLSWLRAQTAGTNLTEMVYRRYPIHAWDKDDLLRVIALLGARLSNNLRDDLHISTMLQIDAAGLTCLSFEALRGLKEKVLEAIYDKERQR